MEDWLEEVSQHAEEDVVKFLIGNKCDLENDRQISKVEG